MAKDTGFGGAFLRVDDPKTLYAWYEHHPGIGSSEGCFSFPARVQRAIPDALSAAGVPLDPKRETYEYGRFGWFTDAEGNRVELWEPART
jgi:hypothetical protein